MAFGSRIANLFKGAAATGSQVASTGMDIVKDGVRAQTQSAGFNSTVGNVSQSVQDGIDAGHQIAAMMQKLSLAAAQDSATKKAGEQVKSAAQ
jgi:hypothetical protein